MLSWLLRWFRPMRAPSGSVELCKALRAFVVSVQPHETRVITLHTSWGTNFKDDDAVVLGAKRCDHSGYAPGKELCNSLMKYSSTEFAGYNVKQAINCLSKQAHLPPGLQIDRGSFSFSHGSEDRGALIEITLTKDKKLGGMALHLQADGY